jgi:hypothetical protein
MWDQEVFLEYVEAEAGQEVRKVILFRIGNIVDFERVQALSVKVRTNR